jgi:hypothetical protein
MLTVTKHQKIIEEFQKIKLPNNFGLISKTIKFKVPGEILKEEFEICLKEELISFLKGINYIVLKWDCVYNDESFTAIELHLEPIHTEDMLYNLFFLKKLFDEINNMYGTVEYEERYREVMKKVISHP